MYQRFGLKDCYIQTAFKKINVFSSPLYLSDLQQSHLALARLLDQKLVLQWCFEFPVQGRHRYRCHRSSHWGQGWTEFGVWSESLSISICLIPQVAVDSNFQLPFTIWEPPPLCFSLSSKPSPGFLPNRGSFQPLLLCSDLTPGHLAGLWNWGTAGTAFPAQSTSLQLCCHSCFSKMLF